MTATASEVFNVLSQATTHNDFRRALRLANRLKRPELDVLIDTFIDTKRRIRGAA